MNNIILFTDLDGTLLDHKNYSWQAASEAIKKLKQHQIPIILNSSKTLVELQSIAKELDICQPLICENGSIVAVNSIQTDCNYDDYTIHRFAKPYQEIVSVINEMRQLHKFNCTGFNDMSVEEIMHHTGLDREAAYAASRREATEPLLWNDSAQSLEKFSLMLEQKGLSITRGGRFYHVMSPVDKGQAVDWLIKYFADDNDNPVITIALGDSENDLAMLKSVNYPVLVNNPDSVDINTSNISNIIKTEQPGPAGWNRAVLDILEQLKEE